MSDRLREITLSLIKPRKIIKYKYKGDGIWELVDQNKEVKIEYQNRFSLVIKDPENLTEKTVLFDRVCDVSAFVGCCEQTIRQLKPDQLIKGKYYTLIRSFPFKVTDLSNNKSYDFMNLSESTKVFESNGKIRTDMTAAAKELASRSSGIEQGLINAHTN